MRFDKTYIIAEIGGNFTDYNTAKRMIDDAAEAGANAVKLQTYRAETITSKSAMFDMENTGVVSQQEYFKQFEIDEKMHALIFQYAKEKGLDIFSTPSHISDVDMLARLGSDVYKIGADDATNLPFLRQVARTGKTIMLSTGMCTMQEVRNSVNAILEEGNSDIVIMHVVSLYPTAPQFVNLKAIESLKKEFPEFTIGYSDHTMTTDACLFAALLGAKVIEKHFTYDKKADGPDHMHSAVKEELKELVNKIRLFELMQGDGIKRPVGDECKNRINNRKSVVSRTSIKAGDVLSWENLDIKRPGMGIEPDKIDLLIGRCAKRDIEEDKLLSWEDVQ